MIEIVYQKILQYTNKMPKLCFIYICFYVFIVFITAEFTLQHYQLELVPRSQLKTHKILHSVAMIGAFWLGLPNP